jgi:hypothetical protein
MLYIIKWSLAEGPRSESKFASWDGRVTDATLVVKWLIGMRVESAIEILQTRYGGRVRLVDGSWNINKIDRALND